MNFNLSLRKLTLEVTIFILLTIYSVFEEGAPSREYIFVIWLLYFILCSVNLNSYTFKSMDQQMKEMHYKIKKHNVSCNDINDVANLLKEAISDPNYEFILGSDDNTDVVIEIRKL